MTTRAAAKVVRILLIEDNLGDVELTREALTMSRILNDFHVAGDGIQALAMLEEELARGGEELPDLILLDLNLPRMDGREVLAKLKSTSRLKRIPIVVLTSSQAEIDIIASYDLHANCFITKPIDFVQFINVVRSIEDFWFTIVRLPPQKD